MGLNKELPGFDFTFVIPCYNEAENLPKLISEITRYVSVNSDCRFILVENGSTDTSRNYLRSLNLPEEIVLVYLDANKGYGGGLWEGIKASESEMTGWFHADLQISFDEVIRMKNLSKAKQCSVKGRRINRPLFDSLLTYGMTLFCSILFLRRLVDINGQPTIYQTKMLQGQESPPQDFSFDLFFYLVSTSKKVNLVRPTVEMLARSGGTSSWNNGFKSRIRMITRTMRYALSLRVRTQID